MKATEILQAAQMYNTIFAALNECKKVNEASNYEGDLLWVDCANGTHYANESGCIIQNSLNTDEYYFCKTLEETAAKYAELCLAAGCSPSDVYTSY